MKTAILYWSKTGNTEKVAHTLIEGLEEARADILLKKIEEADEIDFFAYNLICIGFPSYQWHPPEPMVNFLKNKYSMYRKQEKVKLSAPKIAGKHALIFCTYSGPHTGINEAIPAGKYVGQFFDHLGFTVLDEWYILSEFHGSEANSTRGRMGDIRGKPNEEDLRKIKTDVKNIAGRLS